MSLFKRVSSGIRSRLWKMKLKRLSLGERFDLIYRSGHWFSNGESKSGSGSTLEATASIRRQLPALFDELGANSILDVGCGDFNWMSQVEHSCKYHGVDVAPSLIQANNKEFGSERISFTVLDAVEGPIPQGFDLVMCREVLFHLSNDDSRKLVRNILDSGPRFLMVTTDQRVTDNLDIESGEFRSVNMQIAPFDFPKPLRYIEDSCISQSRAMGVWKIVDLAAPT